MADYKSDTIKIFYHVCCLNNSVYSIVEKMISNIHFSNLYIDCESINVFMSGEVSIINEVKKYIVSSGKKFKIILECPNDNTFERLTLENIHKYISPQDKILYIHTKGVSKAVGQYADLMPNINNWVYFMSYFMVGKYKRCLEKLSEVDVVGCLYKTDPTPHFSGNMWWSTGKYFLTLQHKINNDYYAPEFFLFNNKPSYYIIADGPFHYIDNTPPSYYVDGLPETTHNWNAQRKV